MKFHIIIPTYKRSDKLQAAIQSVMDQTYTDWHIMIVNDSPDDASYAKIEQTVQNNQKITYLKNEKNSGVNFSRNRALNIICKNSISDDWIIFLDDDDTFAKDTLQTYTEIHKKYPSDMWIITNRASYEGISFTKIPQSEKRYSYISDFLLTKKLKGDATHCIAVEEIKNIRFPLSVKQGEEWLFYYQLALKIRKFFYYNHNTTLSAGYGADGLNFRKRTKKERLSTLNSLVHESYSHHILWHPTIIVYFVARYSLLIVK